MYLAYVFNVKDFVLHLCMIGVIQIKFDLMFEPIKPSGPMGDMQW